ncbi:MAG: hypothetical protein RID91_06100 [Azospirillaceae bacterium]
MALTNAEKQARYRARRAAAFARLEAENAALQAEIDLLRGQVAATDGEFRSRAVRAGRTAAQALLASLEESAPDHAAHLRGRLADPSDSLILDWLAAGAEAWLWDSFWLTATAGPAPAPAGANGHDARAAAANGTVKPTEACADDRQGRLFTRTGGRADAPAEADAETG